MGAPKNWPDWHGAHTRYVQEEVRRRHPLSAAFTPASVGVAEVRAWISGRQSATPAARATVPALHELTDFFNHERNDGRQTFVAFAAEFPGLERRSDWAEHMCERCGLDHFFRDTEVTLALFRCRVQEVLDQATHAGAGAALFAVPTV